MSDLICETHTFVRDNITLTAFVPINCSDIPVADDHIWFRGEAMFNMHLADGTTHSVPIVFPVRATVLFASYDGMLKALPIAFELFPAASRDAVAATKAEFKETMELAMKKQQMADAVATKLAKTTRPPLGLEAGRLATLSNERPITSPRIII